MLLLGAEGDSRAAQFVGYNKDSIKRGYFLGGKAAVPDALAAKIKSAAA